MSRWATFLLTFLTALTLVSSAWAKLRVWTDSQGRTVKGEFVRYFEGNVVLKLNNGTAKAIPFENFSAEDQQYLETLIDFEEEEVEEEEVAPQAPAVPGGIRTSSPPDRNGPPGVNPLDGFPPAVPSNGPANGPGVVPSPIRGTNSGGTGFTANSPPAMNGGFPGGSPQGTPAGTMPGGTRLGGFPGNGPGTNFDGPGGQNMMPATPEQMRINPNPNRGSFPGSPTTAPPPKPVTGAEVVVLILALISFGVYVFGLIWLLVRGFQTSIPTGLAMMIVPCYVLVFIITQWEAAKDPVSVIALGFLLMFCISGLASLLG